MSEIFKVPESLNRPLLKSMGKTYLDKPIAGIANSWDEIVARPLRAMW